MFIRRSLVRRRLGAARNARLSPAHAEKPPSSLDGGQGIDGSKPVIAYCRIGERSSHTWFVLKYLLGLGNVTNYDGSWTEWGNLVGASVEKGAAAGAAKG